MATINFFNDRMLAALLGGKPSNTKITPITPVSSTPTTPLGALDRLGKTGLSIYQQYLEKQKEEAGRAEAFDMLKAYNATGGQPAYDAVVNGPMDIDETDVDLDREAEAARNQRGGISALSEPTTRGGENMQMALMMGDMQQRQATKAAELARSQRMEDFGEQERIKSQRAIELKGSPDGKPVRRKTGKDRNGVMRYIDNGARVYPAVKAAVDPKAEYTLGADGDQSLTRKGKERFEEKWRTRIKPQVDQLQEVDRKLRIVTKALDQKTGTADIAAINAYQRMLDEGVVRGEDITTQASAKSAYDTVTLWLANKKEGDLLPQPVRDKMRTMANILSRQTVAGISTTLNSWREVVLDTPGLEWKNIMPLGLDAFLTTGMTKADKKALDWGKKNPNDPRAIKLKNRLGVR